MGRAGLRDRSVQTLELEDAEQAFEMKQVVRAVQSATGLEPRLASKSPTDTMAQGRDPPRGPPSDGKPDQPDQEWLKGQVRDRIAAPQNPTMTRPMTDHSPTQPDQWRPLESCLDEWMAGRYGLEAVPGIVARLELGCEHSSRRTVLPPKEGFNLSPLSLYIGSAFTCTRERVN